MSRPAWPSPRRRSTRNSSRERAYTGSRLGLAAAVRSRFIVDGSQPCLTRYLLADTRTSQHLVLGKALLQHQHAGILPSFTHPGHVAQDETEAAPLPLSDPLNTLSMPEAWVRAAILIRINSLIRGHSGVRWVLLERMVSILEKNITPLVPLRGSISASGGALRFLAIFLPILTVHFYRPLAAFVRCWYHLW